MTASGYWGFLRVAAQGCFAEYDRVALVTGSWSSQGGKRLLVASAGPGEIANMGQFYAVSTDFDQQAAILVKLRWVVDALLGMTRKR